MTGEKDAPAEMLGSDPSNPTSSILEPVHPAPAEMPGEEAVARAICASDFDYDETVYDTLSSAQRLNFAINARAVLDLFAPILAEAEERAESFKAMYRQAVDWRDEKIAKLTTRAEDAEFAMSRVEKSAASAEARALAAEAALAAERERCAKVAEDHGELVSNEPIGKACSRSIAAAIRAQANNEPGA